MVPGGQGGKSFNYTVQCTASSQPVFRIYCTVYTEGILLQNQLFVVGLDHRRRIKTETKAKVVASVWGTEFILFLWPR